MQDLTLKTELARSWQEFKNKGATPNSVLCCRNPVLPYELCGLQDPDEAALGLRTPHYEPKHMQSTFISLFVM